MDSITPPPRPPNRINTVRPIPGHPSLAKASFLASAADIPATRNELETWLSDAAELSAVRRYEIVLAANELFVNAFQHGDAAAGCLFTMRRVRNQLIVTVTNNVDGAKILPTQWWTMPGLGSRRERGLAIVKSVAADVDLEVTRTAVSITAIFDLHDRTWLRPALEARLGS